MTAAAAAGKQQQQQQPNDDKSPSSRFSPYEYYDDYHHDEEQEEGRIILGEDEASELVSDDDDDDDDDFGSGSDDENNAGRIEGTPVTSPRPTLSSSKTQQLVRTPNHELSTTTRTTPLTKTPIKAEIQNRIARLQEAYQKRVSAVTDPLNDRELKMISRQVEEAIEKIEALNIAAASSHHNRTIKTSMEIPDAVVLHNRAAREEKVTSSQHKRSRSAALPSSQSLAAESPVLKRLQEAEQRAKRLLQVIEQSEQKRRISTISSTGGGGVPGDGNHDKTEIIFIDDENGTDGGHSRTDSRLMNEREQHVEVHQNQREICVPALMKSTEGEQGDSIQGDSPRPKTSIHVPALDVDDIESATEEDDGSSQVDRESLSDEVPTTNENRVKPRSDADPDSSIDDHTNVFGREIEFARLKNVFSHVGVSSERMDCSPHVWVSGPSGIGKRALVDAFVSTLPEKDFFVCRGTFGLNIDTSPHFSGIVGCFSDLFALLQSDNDKWVIWKQRLHDASNDDLDILSSVLSTLPGLFDSPHRRRSSTKYKFDPSGMYLFQRLKLALKNIISKLSRHKAIVFYLRNLQWASEDSIEILVTLLLSGNQNFVLIGCYENVEGPGMHALKQLTTKVMRGPSEHIFLGKIDISSSKSMLRRHLYRIQPSSADCISDEFVSECIRTWFGKATSLNPLCLQEIATLMHEKGSLYFNKGRWKLQDNVEIPRGSSNIARELLNVFPETEKAVLGSAAALSMAEFDVNDLCAALSALKGFAGKLTPDEVEVKLDNLREKMIVTSHRSKHSFCHDVIRNTAYSSLAVCPEMHLTIARGLKELKQDHLADPSHQNDSRKLSALHQFFEGWSAIDNEDEKLMVKKLTVEVAEKAMSKASFDSAVRILERGMTTFDKKNNWKTHYLTTLHFHLSLARCHFVKRNYDKARTVSNIVITNASSPKDKVGAFELLVRTYLSLEQYEEAKTCCLRALETVWQEKLIEMDVEKLLSKVRSLIKETSDADILVLPTMTHKKNSSKMQFLLFLAESCESVGHHKMQDLAALRMMELTMKFGSYQQGVTALVLSFCGICLSRRHFHGEAYRYGHLAELLGDDHSENGNKAIVNFHCGIHHWKVSARRSKDPMLDVCNSSMSANHLDCLSTNVGSYLSIAFVSGLPLDTGNGLFECFLAKQDAYTLPNSWSAIFPHNMILNFIGQEKRQIKVDTLDMRATEYEVWFQIVKSVFFGEIDEAELLSTKMKLKLDGVWVPYRAWIDGLIATHQARCLTGKERASRIAKASRIIEILTSWVKNGTKHISHMPKILQVELNLASDKDISARKVNNLLKSALDTASQEGYIHHEALANERAGDYFQSVSENQLAAAYLSQAVRLYEMWGATAKVAQLKNKFGEFFNATPPRKTNALSCGAYDRLLFSPEKGQNLQNQEPSSRSRSMSRQGSSRRAVSLDRLSSHHRRHRPTPLRHNSSNALMTTSFHSLGSSTGSRKGLAGARRNIIFMEPVEKRDEGKQERSGLPDRPGTTESSSNLETPKPRVRKVKGRGRSSEPTPKGLARHEAEEDLRPVKHMSFFQKISGGKKLRGRSLEPVPNGLTRKMRSASPGKKQRGRSSERALSKVTDQADLSKPKRFLQKIKKRVRSRSRSASLSASRSISTDQKGRGTSIERIMKWGRSKQDLDSQALPDKHLTPAALTRRSSVAVTPSSMNDNKPRRSILTRALSWGNHGEKAPTGNNDKTARDTSNDQLWDIYGEGSGSFSSISLEDFPRERRGKKKSEHLAQNTRERKSKTDTKTLLTDDVHKERTPTNLPRLSAVNLNGPTRRSVSPTRRRRRSSSIDKQSRTTKKGVFVTKQQKMSSSKYDDDEDDAVATTDNTTTSTAVPNKLRSKIKVKKRTAAVTASS